MSEIRILLLEDDPAQRELCESAADEIRLETKDPVVIVSCATYDEAVNALSGILDGAIVDLKLASGGKSGADFVDRLSVMCNRIPVTILSGTPNEVPNDAGHFQLKKKGDRDASYFDLIKYFIDIHKTGLTKILGGRGVVEKHLQEIFQKSLKPSISKWISYGREDSEASENALLRHTLNHLIQLLDAQAGSYYSEEFFSINLVKRMLCTGALVKGCDDKLFVVLSPACDLAIQKSGSMKTEHVLLVEIQSFNKVDGSALNSEKTQKLRNNARLYCHYIPKSDHMSECVINFRLVKSVGLVGFDDEFKYLPIRISAAFVKDIVSRFSSYYARQGQPEIRDLELKKP